MIEKVVSKTDELEGYFKKYPDVNPECIIKADLITQGLSFTEAALQAAKGAQSKGYYLFSFDRSAVKDMSKKEHVRAPEDIRIKGGPYNLRPTVSQVRIGVKSPYSVDVVDGKLNLLAGGRPIADLEYVRPPKYYSATTSDGASCAEIASSIGWGYMVFCTVLRNCQYWGDKEECKFCDINSNLRQHQQDAQRSFTVHKSVQQVAETMEHIFVTDYTGGNDPHCIWLSGGTILKQVKGRDELDFYLDYVRAVRERVGSRWPIVLQSAAKTKKDCKRMSEAGVTNHNANIEVWDKELFRIICPGKESLVGYDEWIKRVIESVEVFGEGNVCPNLVVGVETCQPWGFKSIDEAVKSTLSGLDYLMAHGVTPRVTPWCVEPLSALGNNQPPPLDYHIRVIRGWHELFSKYRLDQQSGVGPMGPGRSCYPTAAWLDFDPALLH